MSKVAVMMSAEQANGQMSSHFGKAEWIMIADKEGGVPEFVKNDALNGRGAAGIVIEKGCSDVVLVDIGDGALGHLRTANIGAWAAPGPLTGEEALRLFRQGQLPAVPAGHAPAHHGGGGGCCCSGGGAKGGSPCCRG
jgi:predicted Fe-Mo cluster-binding NifX family protein